MNTKLSISPLYSLDKILLLLVFLRIRRKEIFVFEPFCDSRQYYQFQEMCFDLVKRVIDDQLMLLVASNLVVEQDNFSFHFLSSDGLVGQQFSNCIENYNTHMIIENLFEFESSSNKDPVEKKSIVLSYYLKVLYIY